MRRPPLVSKGGVFTAPRFQSRRRICTGSGWNYSWFAVHNPSTTWSWINAIRWSQWETEAHQTHPIFCPWFCRMVYRSFLYILNCVDGSDSEKKNFYQLNAPPLAVHFTSVLQFTPTSTRICEPFESVISSHNFSKSSVQFVCVLTYLSA